ncbi:MAG TPA: EMC3/TMCO1 family protein [Thermoproteota archaeon]|nr:EMC3/TMCO1 family protein [Thermoproteota archaeon]
MDFITTLLLVTGAAIFNSVGNTLLSAKITDPEKLKRLQQETKDYREQLDAAKKASDMKVMKSLEKRKKYIEMLSNEISSALLKQTLASLAITLVAFYLVLWLIPQTDMVAYVSTYLWNPEDGLIGLNSVYWFVVTTSYFSIVSRKVLGLA